MVDSVDEPPLSIQPHSWAKSKTPYPLPTDPTRAGRLNPDSITNTTTTTTPTTTPSELVDHHAGNDPSSPTAGFAHSEPLVPVKNKLHKGTPVMDEKGDGTQSTALGSTKPKASLGSRFIRDVKRIIFSSWVNWLLIFVPVGMVLGIMVDWAHSDIVSPTVVFAVNAVAIIPLASLLSYATESVASKLGDTVGALLNVTFGNAVELIIFILALVAGKVQVVQAAAIGSILSNLLLILGMCFVAGGLRYREQLYNSTVSQMSACLLCLSVISLLLPTAFHASFNDTNDADRIVLKVSRGTSVVLLLVYILYLLFQLKSHAFMYTSTPQHLIDEVSHPGVLADILNSSSSSDDSSSSSSSDSDSSRGSHTTAKRIKRALRRKRRKSISSSKENSSVISAARTPSDGTNPGEHRQAKSTIESSGQSRLRQASDLEPVFSGDEADLDGEGRTGRRRSPRATIHTRDFEAGSVNTANVDSSSGKKSKKHKKHKHSKHEVKEKEAELEQYKPEPLKQANTPTVGFVPEVEVIPGQMAAKRQFNIRNISETVRPAFNSTVFPHHEATGRPGAMPLSVLPNVNVRPQSNHRSSSTRGLRRTSSMPDIHSAHIQLHQRSPSGQYRASVTDVEAQPVVESVEIVETKQHLSKTSSVILLLCSTGMVALCAEFLVGSIDYLIANSGVSQAFIGLIILPIVGNAAEHVTAVTVAAKNKMDLAINIALGSSIQIALFVTPFMVILGWIIKEDMSLYFSLFETVSLFASAFIVSFLMIDGRSNYLEGALLIAAYTIIAVSAFFYPSCDLSSLSGPSESVTSCS